MVVTVARAEAGSEDVGMNSHSTAGHVTEVTILGAGDPTKAYLPGLAKAANRRDVIGPEHFIWLISWVTSGTSLCLFTYVALLNTENS